MNTETKTQEDIDEGAADRNQFGKILINTKL